MYLSHYKVRGSLLNQSHSPELCFESSVIENETHSFREAGGLLPIKGKWVKTRENVGERPKSRRMKSRRKRNATAKLPPQSPAERLIPVTLTTHAVVPDGPKRPTARKIPNSTLWHHRNGEVQDLPSRTEIVNPRVWLQNRH